MGKIKGIKTHLQQSGLLVFILIMVVVLALLSDRFLTPANLINILRQASINGIISVGMMLVILTAGIDLSVGAILALSVVVTADLMHRGLPPLAALLSIPQPRRLRRLFPVFHPFFAHFFWFSAIFTFSKMT